MNKKIYILVFILGIFMLPQLNYAQVDFNKKPDDDLGNLEDKFQESFYEALKQRGIENYDKSIDALLKCIDLDNQVSVLYFELGKSYYNLKKFSEAEKSFKKAIELEPNNEWYLDALYGYYAFQNDYENAIEVVKKLIVYYPDYKEDLASLYLETNKYDEALKLLDELDTTLGFSVSRDIIRNRVYDATGRKKDQIENLESRIESNPDKESNYLALIYRYSENNETAKAFETAKELLEINPNSQLVHLALYKFYLDANDAEEAVKSMKTVVNSQKIQPEAKLKVLSDFVNFVKQNPKYEPDLIEATGLVSNDENEIALVELGQYYLSNNDKEKALGYFEQALKQDPNNFNILRNVLLLQIDLKRFKEAYEGSSKILEIYPSQPIIYLINAVALNELNKPNNAIESLEMGLDYIIDNNKMEVDFYNQMSIAFTKLNNTVKALTFSDKAKQLQSLIND